MIEVEEYSKAYKTTLAVDRLSFRVEPGQILGLVGPNGAGKTSTLRAIAGIIAPTDGRLSVDGHDLATAAPKAKRQLAYVPDDPNLFDSLTVWEHLEFIAATYQVPDYRPRAEHLLAQFELTDKRDALAQSLSRGMRQKVAICCAYLHAPRAILLDEPLTGLDPRGIRTMKNSVREQAAGHNGVGNSEGQPAAVIISSHLLGLVEDLCTHLLILHHGRRLLFSPISEARSAVGDLADDVSLEEIFFHVTEGPSAAMALPNDDRPAASSASESSSDETPDEAGEPSS